MNFLQRLYLLLALVIVSPIYSMETQQQTATSIVIELGSIADTAQHIDVSTLGPDDWVILDLDNTVMWPEKESVFSDHGFKTWATHHAQERDVHINDAYNALLTFWFDHQKHETVQPVESCIVEFINQLQKQNAVVMALSSRSRTVIADTVRMLKSLNIDFSKTCPKVGDVCFDHLPHKDEDGQSVSIYHEGIGGCGNNGKGPILEMLLTKAPTKPRRIVLFDDLEKHIIAVQAVAQKYNIGFYGFRYGYLDKQVANFKLEDHMHTIPQKIRHTYASKKTQATA